MKSIIVLVTHGKGIGSHTGSVDQLTIHLFKDEKIAEEFVKTTNASNGRKYWSYAEIVSPQERVELYAPDVEDGKFVKNL